LFYCCNNNNSDFPEFKIKIYTDAITEYKEELDYVNALYFLQNTTSEDEDVNEDEDADMDNMFYKKMFSYLNNLENVYAARDHDAANLLWNHYERENKYITVFTFDGFIKYPNGAMIVRDSFFQI
jgi:aminoglycoside/choline kinase family phosphotransferase